MCFCLEFGESAKAIASEVKNAVPISIRDVNLAGGPKTEVQKRLESIAELSPRAAILEAWLQVETAAADVIRKKGLGKISPYPGPLRLRESLQKGEILNNRQLLIFEKLRQLRNEAVHVPEAQFTQEAVTDYLESAIAMASYLEDMASEP